MDVSIRRQQLMIWVALVEIEAIEGNDMFLPGEMSFVTACVDATSASDAEEKLAYVLDIMCFHVVGFEDTHLWMSDSGEESPPGLLEMVSDAERSGKAQFGTFHTWENQG